MATAQNRKKTQMSQKRASFRGMARDVTGAIDWVARRAACMINGGSNFRLEHRVAT